MGLSNKIESKGKILVVDDDHSILEVMNIILNDNGYEVISIADGGKVMDAILQHFPKVVLLDIWMSGQDGRDIMNTIKNNPKTSYIPIILVSANNETEKIAKESKADDFLAKPFNIEDLISLVDKYSSRSSNTVR